MIISRASAKFTNFLRYAHSTCWPAPVSKHNTDYFNSSPELPSISSAVSSWMASLPDQLPLHQISIPGTHDSGSYCKPKLAIDEDEPLPINIRYEAQCQSWSITDQLRAGIRYLDLRVAEKNG